jgi:hypothetical protein
MKDRKRDKPDSRGTVVLETLFAIWYWRADEGKIYRWWKDPHGIREKTHEGLLFGSDGNTPNGATRFACQREYRLLLKESHDALAG